MLCCTVYSNGTLYIEALPGYAMVYGIQNYKIVIKAQVNRRIFVKSVWDALPRGTHLPEVFERSYELVDS